MNDLNKTKQQLIRELEELRYQLSLNQDAQRQELSDINAVLMAINSTLNLDEVVARVMQALNKVFKFDQIAIFIFNAENNCLEVTNWYGEGVTAELENRFTQHAISIDLEEEHLVRCFLDSEPKIINHITPELLEHYCDADLEMFEWNPHKGIASFPLEVQGKVIGTISYVNTLTPFSLRRHDVHRIGRYVAAIATTINNAYLVRKTQYALERSRAREREIEHLNRVILTTNASLDLDEVFAAIQLGLKDIFEFDAVGIQLVNEAKSLLNIHKVYGDVVTEKLLQQWRAIQISTRQDDSASSYVYVTGEIFYFPKITANDAFTETDKQFFRVKPFSAYLALPLFVLGETIGVISFFREQLFFNLEQSDLDRIERYVASLSTAINNARNYERARNHA